MVEPIRTVPDEHAVDIVVISHKGSPWIDECLESIGDYPVHVIDGGDSFDPAAFYYARDRGLSEFILWHDTAMVKNREMLSLFSRTPGNVALMPGFLSCMGKYVVSTIPPLPDKPHGKHAAVRFETHYLRQIQPDTVLFPNMYDTNVFEDKNGRNNMIIENEYFKKYKGYYNLDLVNRDYGYE